LIARGKLEVILGVLGPRLAGGKLEHFEPPIRPHSLQSPLSGLPSSP
jgi:hypothetical protein